MPEPFVMPAADQFRDAIAQEGIAPPDKIIADGKLHRFSSSGRRGDDAGWYVFREGHVSAGAYGDFRSGLRVESWVANLGRPLTAAERIEFQKQQAQIRADNDIKQEERQNRAKMTTYGLGRASIPADASHPYLIKKDVGVHGRMAVWEGHDVSVSHDDDSGKDFLQIRSLDSKLRVNFVIDMEGRTLDDVKEEWSSILLIPITDDTGSVQSFQFISKNGQKKYLSGGKTQGNYFPLGDAKDEDIIMIAEGYATAATIHEITGRPVIVAFDAGNLIAVAQSIRAQRPDARIILCADDDWKSQRIGKGGIVIKNPGLTDAKAAAEAINGEVVIPEFGKNRPDKATDFNDMATLEGKVAVTTFFTKRSLMKENRMTQISHHNDNDEYHTGFSRPGASPQPSPETPPTSGRIFTGTITNFGPAPYKNNPAKNQSYFITLGTGEDARTVWGVELGKALIESGFNVGDQVAIYDKGKVPVQVMSDVRDERGNVVGQRPIGTHRNEWYIGSLDEYIESRKRMAQEMAATEPEPDEERDMERARREASAAAKHPSAPRQAYEPQPVREPIREPMPKPKVHFTDEDFSVIQKIWKDVPRQASRHSESGYDLLLDNKSKVRVTKNRIEMAKKPKQRPDAAYLAACEHARHFWNGEMEVQGDIQHRMKAYAYATAYGVKVTNYTPNDRELIEVNKIIESLHKEAEPGFRRPTTQPGRRPTARLDA